MLGELEPKSSLPAVTRRVLLHPERRSTSQTEALVGADTKILDAVRRDEAEPPRAPECIQQVGRPVAPERCLPDRSRLLVAPEVTERRDLDARSRSLLLEALGRNARRPGDFHGLLRFSLLAKARCFGDELPRTAAWATDAGDPVGKDFDEGSQVVPDRRHRATAAAVAAAADVRHPRVTAGATIRKGAVDPVTHTSHCCQR